MKKAKTDYLTLPLGSPPQSIQLGAHSRHGTSKKRETYCLHELWCLNLFYQGEGTVLIQGKVREFHAGYAVLTPPNTEINYTFYEETALTYVHFKPEAVVPKVKVPMTLDLGIDFECVIQDIQMIAKARNPEPEYIRARVWDVLWKIARHSSVIERPRYSVVVEEALDLIDRQLSKPICIRDLARALKISHTHLNRLFAAEFGISANRYVRKKRVERALHLLKNSSLPIQSVGASVGIPDPHHFNKTIRQTLGVSPFKIRSG